jgi:hypothetical protein
MFVGNFTPDPIEWWHIGVNGIIAPGEIKEFDEARAKHILTKFENIGLVQMEWSEDPEYKTGRMKVSLERWENFWMRQITNFNQHNEQLKNEGKAYIHPQPKLVEHAKTLKVKLVTPWQVQERSDNAVIEEQKKEINDLRGMVGDLSRQVSQLVVQMSTPGNDDIRRRFKLLNKKEYADFVEQNADQIVNWPVVLYAEAMTKFQSFYPDADWPVPNPLDLGAKGS